MPSQQIQICRGIERNGTPKEESTFWAIPKEGGTLTAVYHPAKGSADSLVKLRISSHYLGEWTETFNNVQTMGDAAYAAWEFRVYEAGTYKAELYSNDSVLVASREFRVMILTGESSRYESTEIEVQISDTPFSTESDEGHPSEKTKRERDSLYVQLKGRTGSLNTEKITCDLWKVKPEGGFHFVLTEKFKVKEEWEDTHFRIARPEPGKYVLSVYSEDHVFMGKKEFDITQ